VAIATARALVFSAAVQGRFPSARFEGIYSCRHIIPHDGGGSSEWSEHAWGNAVDFGGSDQTMSNIMAFAERNKDSFGIDNIIGPGSAVDAVHVDFFPNHYGQVPPCAGGPGVSPHTPGGTGTPTTGGNSTIDQYGQANQQSAFPQQGPLPGGFFAPFSLIAIKTGRVLEVTFGGGLIFVGVLLAAAGMTGAADTALGIATKGVVSNAQSRITEPALRRRRSIIQEASVSGAEQREAARRETVGYTAEQRRQTQAAAARQQQETARAKGEAFAESRTRVARERGTTQRATTKQRYTLMSALFGEKEAAKAKRKPAPKKAAKK